MNCLNFAYFDFSLFFCWGGGGDERDVINNRNKLLKNCLQPRLPSYLACWLIFFTQAYPNFTRVAKNFKN